MLVVLKLAPYDSDGDDQAAFVSSFTLFLTMLCAFAIMKEDPNAPNMDSNIVGYILIGISSLCLLAEIAIMISTADLSVLKRCKSKKKNKNKTDLVKVAPEPESSNEDATPPPPPPVINVQKLREIRLKYGAGSEEYIQAARDAGSLTNDSISSESLEKKGEEGEN